METRRRDQASLCANPHDSLQMLLLLLLLLEMLLLYVLLLQHLCRGHLTLRQGRQQHQLCMLVMPRG